MSAFPYGLLVIATDIAKGNRIAAVFDRDRGGAQTFGGERRIYVRPVGSAGTDTAGAAKALLTPGQYAIAQEFAAGGYPAVLIAAGLSAEEMDDIRASLIMSVGPRETHYGPDKLAAFIASAGYEIVQSG